LPQDDRPTENQLETIEKEIDIDEQESDLYRQENGTLEDYNPKDDDIGSKDFSGFDGAMESQMITSISAIVVFMIHFIK
jgi:hypothetical protein